MVEFLAALTIAVYSFLIKALVVYKLLAVTVNESLAKDVLRRWFFSPGGMVLFLGLFVTYVSIYHIVKFLITG